MTRKPFPPYRDRPVLHEDPVPFGRDPGRGGESFEQFKRYFDALEAGPDTTLSHLLIEDGISLPSTDTLTEYSVHEKLWEVIRAMARHRHYLYFTDHLSDFELYRKLWEEVLNDPTNNLTPDMCDCACNISLVEEGSDEGDQNWLRYYARAEDREHWALEFPDVNIPERATPPYDRDRHLPTRPVSPDEGGSGPARGSSLN